MKKRRLSNFTPLTKRWNEGLIWRPGLLLAFIMLFSQGIKAEMSTTPKENQILQSTEKTITGTIIDEQGEPIPGVSVVLKGTTKGTITDIDGNFTLPGVTSEDVLVLSFIGMKTQEILIGNQSSLNVTLMEESLGLDEVVVVGFGSQKKANLTGSVSSIDSESLESRPVKNVGEALQGVIPGLNMSVSGMGGELNQSMSINIRGAGTIGSGSSGSPLVLIDGVEGDLNSINPNDISDITVLKDAAASSIYGSRAAFGVIMITTKEGVAGDTKVNYNNNFRWTSPLNLPSMMDSHTFALYYNEAAANAGQGPKFSEEVLERIVQYQNGEIDYGTVPTNTGDRYQYYTGSNGNTDWFKEQYKDAAFAQDHNVSVSGGNKNSRYYTSAGYMDQEGLGRHTNDDLQRYTLTAKLNADLSEHVKLNTSTKFVRTDYQKATHMTGLFYHNIARRWPTVPVTDPNGYYTDPSEIAQLRDGGVTSDQNDWLYLQGQLVITPVENWNIYAEGNYNIQNYNNHSDVTPAYAYDVEGNPYPVAVGWNAPGYTYVYEYNRKSNFFGSNIYSDYEFDIAAAHNFKVMAGFNSELNKYRTIGASRTNLITPSLPTINTATDDSKATEGQYQHWSTAGFFGRLNYNYKERYLLEVNARYDGSSRFLDEKRWNLFPSFSAGWNIAKENFWTFDDVIQMLKIRGSYGELGNQNTNNWYPFYSQMPVGVNNGSWLINGERPTTASAPGIVSSLLTWERVTSWNVGADIAFLSNRLNVNFDYFERTTFDMVGPAPKLPTTLGTSVPQINNADMRSYGFELEALWKDKIGDFSYSVRGVLSDDQQEVTKYPNPTNDIGQWYEGRKSGEIWGYETVGLAQTQEQMDAHLAQVNQSTMGSNWQAGDLMYADVNGDGEVNSGSYTTDDPGDIKIIGNSTPRYRYSIDLNASYKGFDMRAFFQGIGKRDWMLNGPYFWGATGNMWQATGFEEHMDFYRDENSVMVQAGIADVNKDAYFPKPYFGNTKNTYTTTRYIQDASYLRLKNLQFGYTLPETITSRVGISRARFFVSGENLLTFTDLFEVFDPETVGLSGWNDGKTYPLAKVISCGVNINF
ncbi:TonB-linked SusC/RagA family outer membrane protein [Marinilabilia salmonicolor]|jgi:TonB-linked SusC/RagA family outer membrane protein|uniref:SusC/RagA family TonB-linked outer membrane protein n=1 Tax=Marinilabilia salmonicolor TaxID=989 RepID=UPI000D051E44|nr:TonB-dependent receptor [Marinilabilia salmonicolor]PRZ01628.1 TonB-linked SusC/RagA family outer membrane protein [Marinilabilia salmonicolor]